MLYEIFMFLKSIFFTGSYSNQVFPDPLTKEEEDACIKKAKMGDKESRNKLIEHNLRLVAHIVKKFDSKYVDQDDLISIGTIGLIKGVDTFSNDKGVRITTYCARCIENATFTCWKLKSVYQNKNYDKTKKRKIYKSYFFFTK